MGGTAYNESVPVVITENSDVYFLLVEEDGESDSSYFRLKAMRQDTSLFLDRKLGTIALHRPSGIKMIQIERRLYLFWVEQEKLYQLALDLNGNMLGIPVLLSGEHAVETFSVAVPANNVPVLWFSGSRRAPGLYGLESIDGSSSPIEIDSQGVNPQLRYDRNDVLHASWAFYPVGYGVSEIYYASYAEESDWNATQPVVVTEIAINPSSSLYGPALGVDDDTSYVFWTIMIRSGIQAGTIQTEYAYASSSQPSQFTRPQSIGMPLIYALNHVYIPNTNLDAGERVALPDRNLPLTPDLQEITPNVAAADELAIAFRTTTQHLWRKERIQVNVAYLNQGVPTSYQPLSFTTTLSTAPYITNSRDKHMYITWLEKQVTEQYSVYFASTSPEIMEVLNQSTGRDFLKIVAEITFGLLIGILLAPIGGALWALAPLVALLVTAPLRKIGSEKTQAVFTVISILVALVVYWMSKVATLPGMMQYIPFSAWIPEIPSLVGNILRWVVPALITALALWIAWRYTYQRSNKSTLYFILIFVGVDALFTAGIYAVLIYGAI